MEEKIIISGKAKKVIILWGIIIGLSATLVEQTGNCISSYSNYWYYKFDNWFSYVLLRWPELVFQLAIILFLLVCIFTLKSSEIIVTDKRIYGKTIGGKRIDLPIDKVSAVSSFKLVKGITVSTSSGKISFALLKNSSEIREEISKLLISRQQEKNNTVTNITQSHSEADEIKKYKDLLDSGIISQEEFDAKKKQLLGL